MSGSKEPSKRYSGSARGGEEDFSLRILRWQAIKGRMAVILWPLSVLFLIIVGWAGWTIYVRHQNAEALAIYEGAVIQSQDKKVPALEQLVKEYPNTKAGRLAGLDLAHLYYRAGKTDLAIKAYERVLENLPEDQGLRPIIFLSLGYCFEMKGDYPAAVKYLNLSLESGRDSVKVVSALSLGRVYNKAKEPTKAIDVYKKALSINGVQGYYRSIAEWQIAQLTLPQMSSGK